MRTGCKPRPDMGATSSPRCLRARAGQHPAPAPRAVLGTCILLPSHDPREWLVPAPTKAWWAQLHALPGAARLSKTPICFGFRRCPAMPPFLPRACGYPGPRMTLEHPLGRPTGSRVFPGQAQLVPQPRAGPYIFKSLSREKVGDPGLGFQPQQTAPGVSLQAGGTEPITPWWG